MSEKRILRTLTPLAGKMTTQDHEKLGYYRHFKGAVYEVVAIVTDAQPVETRYVYYRDNKGKHWVRRYDDFFGHVDRELYHGPRFTLLEQEATPLQLFVETLRKNRAFFQEQKDASPTFVSGGGYRSLLYVVGDKIAFATSIRLITKLQAGKLFDWLQTWR